MRLFQVACVDSTCVLKETCMATVTVIETIPYYEIIVNCASCQIVNGIMEREDWETAIKTPVGMLPLGSGNALCASSLHESG